MSSVNTYNDFGQLEEIVIGSADHYHIPDNDVSLRHFFGLPPDHPVERVPAADLARIIVETQADLEEFGRVLTSLGVRVRRPEPVPQGWALSMPEWATTANHALMPRDCLLVIGDTIIEAPMPVRARYAETFPYRGLLREYFDTGANWLAAPKPRLRDDTYEFSADGPVLAENEPLFDAANIIRCGSDVFFNVSNTGNRIGAEWLRRVLGPRFRVHEISICDDHVGTTLHVLRPGVLLANAGRLGPDTIPEPLRGWKVLWFEAPEDDGFALSWSRASIWVGMNIVSVNEETVIVPDRQLELARMLEKEGFTTIPVRYRHGRTFGGGFHCCSLDIRRQSSLESYL